MAAAAAYPINAVRTAIGPLEPTHIRRMDKAGSPVIFFDNDPAKINDVSLYCNDIELVEVNESAYDEIKNNPDTVATNPAYEPLWAGFPLDSNGYTWLHTYNDLSHLPFDIRSGIQLPEIAILRDWVERTAELGVERTAIFDWDRTLSMTEGIRLPMSSGPGPNSLISKIHTYKPFNYFNFEPDYFIGHMLAYCCGGPIRLLRLKEMFALLRERGIKIAILTNNGSCNNQSAPYFRELVTELVGAVPDFICGQLYGGHKGVAMRDYLPALCTAGMQGGSRVAGSKHGGGRSRVAGSKHGGRKTRHRKSKRKHSRKVLH